jgi:hypothetical protein
MSETLTAIEVNCETGEVTNRPLTAEEIAQRETDAEAYAIQKAAEDATAASAAEAKASGIAKLLALGLTEAEANALVK